MKKLCLTLLCGLLALGLAACGDEQKQTEQVWLQTKQVTYVAGGEPVFELEREYDDAGRVVEKREAYEGEYDNRTEYTYDAAGNVTHTAQYQNDWLWLTTDTTYAEAGDELEYKEYRAADEGSELILESCIANEYDERGYLVRTNCLNENGELYYYDEYQNDEAGQMLKGWHYFASGLLDWHELADYDEQGNRSWYGYYVADQNGELGIGTVTEYEYDEAGHMIVERVLTVNDEHKRVEINRREYDYDEAGHQVARREYLDDELRYWQYDTYDEQGRLVNRVVGQYDIPYDNNIGYVYDEFGNVIRRTSFRESHEVDMYAEFEYVQMELTPEQADRARKEQKEWWAGI